MKVSFGTGSLLLEIGRLRAILRHFPNSFFVSQRQSWKVVDLMGDAPQNPVLSSELRRRAARAISQIEEEWRMRRYAGVIRDLEEARKRLEARSGLAHIPKEPSISESQIMLVSPAYAQVVLYPKIAMCDNCKTFIDLEKLLRASRHSPSCPACGGSLLQINIVFVCPRCSRVVELRPPKSIGKPNPNGTFICKECKEPRRPLMLDLARENLSKSRWTCPECDKKASVYMKCEQCGNTMALRQTTQESLYARHVSVLLLGGRLFEESLCDVDSLKGLKLSEAVQNEQERAALRDVFALKDATLIPEVTSAIGVYGYSAFRDGAVIPFKYGRDSYKVYCYESRGMAILFRFDDQQVDSVASDEEQRFTLLHSIAHALVKQSALEAGVEEGTFLAKVFDRDCAVLLYEARGAEAGGLEYVFKYRLPNLFINARRMLSQCRYQCESACFDCLFINNALCHPIADYIPPNSFLDRHLVLRLWGYD